VFNQPPRPTQPGHPSGVGKVNTENREGNSRIMEEVWSSVHGVCSLLAQDLGNGDEHCTIVAELWTAMLTGGKFTFFTYILCIAI